MMRIDVVCVGRLKERHWRDAADEYLKRLTPYARVSVVEIPDRDVTADEAPDVRQSALADLRTNGDDAARLADVLTAEFPADVLAVPYEVERGAYDGEDAWIVFESWTSEGAELTGRRVWVFAHDDLSMLAAHSVR